MEPGVTPGRYGAGRGGPQQARELRETITLNQVDDMELVGEECLQVREPRGMITSNRVSDLDATEPETKSTGNVHMMNRMAVPGMVAEEVNLVMVEEVTVVKNQVTEKMITVVADKVMVEANLANGRGGEPGYGRGESYGRGGGLW